MLNSELNFRKEKSCYEQYLQHRILVFNQQKCVVNESISKLDVAARRSISIAKEEEIQHVPR